MKTLIILISILCAGQAWAFEPAWNIPAERSTSKSVIVKDYSTGKYVTLYNTPDCPRSNPCPWTHMSVPVCEVDAYYKLGWEPFGVVKYIGYKAVIWIKKRICQEGK